jgi:tRNA A64-2'-O-ribosylphosphate transferase
MEEDWQALPFYPIVCITASEAVADGLDRRNGYTYVQGAADDEESWSLKLSPELFWLNRVGLLSCSTNVECEEQVKRILESHVAQTQAKWALIGATGIAIGNHFIENTEAFDFIISCDYEFNQKNALNLRISAGKRGQIEFFNSIQIALDFYKAKLSENKTVLICCSTGKDHSVGIAICLLLAHFQSLPVTKDTVLGKLLYIQSFWASAAPSRATMKKINLFFMSDIKK